MYRIFLVFAILLGACSFQKASRSIYARHFFAKNAKLKKSFDRKIKQKPSWMMGQIQRDLGSIQEVSLEALDQTSQKALGKGIRVLRYRIVGNRLYFLKEGAYPLIEPEENFQRALVTLCHLASVPDVDFIMNHEDGTFEPFYISEKQAPIFGWAKLKTTPFLVLIPDYRSIACWFNDLRKLTEGKNFSGKKIPWKNKVEKAFWRGGLTNIIQRLEICKLSNNFPHLVDAGLCWFSEEEGWADYTKSHASYEEHMLCKYLPVLDGIMCTYPGYQWRLFSECLTMKQESEQIQWFYHGLEPYKHYLPIKNDISDLIEKIAWAKENDAACQLIAKNAKEFALEHLMFDDIYAYLYLAISEYASCLDKSSHQAMKTTSTDSNWEEILFR